MSRLAATVLAAFAVGGAATSGAAGAAAAPLPVLTLTCSGDVWGLVGQPVNLSPVAVVDKVTSTVRETPGLGAGPAATAGWAFGLVAPFRVGEIPNGTGRIDGAAIADRVVDQALRVAPLSSATDQVKATAAARLREAVASACGMNAKAYNAKAGEPSGQPSQNPPQGPTPPATPATPPSSQAPSGGGTGSDPGAGAGPAPGTSSGDRAAPRDYGSTPFVVPGQFSPSPELRYGGVPGTTPQLIPVNNTGDEIRVTGDARALPGSGRAGVELPVLLALLALSGVTAALVRTWVLRRG